MKKKLTIEEQIAAIAKSDANQPVIPTYNLPCGKHKGESIETLLKTNKDYLKWFISWYDKIPANVEEYLLKKL